MSYEIYPRVFPTKRECNVYIKAETTAPVSIKIQPMEKYSIEHTKKYRIDEENRYPYLPMTACGDGVYTIKAVFTSEQKYSVRIRSGEREVEIQTYVYTADDDLFLLDVFKGDTHLHANRSDGEGTPFEVGVAYRRAGYDFIAITDHHKMHPSIEGKEEFEALTDKFAVIRAEEVHNKDMGYFHVVNLGADSSVNTVIEIDDAYVEREKQKILDTTDFPADTTPSSCAWRIFIANEIRARGGLAVLAHPFWDCYGEYNAETEDVRFLIKNGYYDAYELLSDCDRNGNGNNLQFALWTELQAEGADISVLGASDAHSTTTSSLFNKQFSLVFAEDRNNILPAIKRGSTVAVDRRSESDFTVFGNFRLTKYARFLMDFYFPKYARLTEIHAEALACKNTYKIDCAEKTLDDFRREFFATEA